jgi:hypothetical protein
MSAKDWSIVSSLPSSLLDLIFPELSAFSGSEVLVLEAPSWFFLPSSFTSSSLLNHLLFHIDREAELVGALVEVVAWWAFSLVFLHYFRHRCWIRRRHSLALEPELSSFFFFVIW